MPAQPLTEAQIRAIVRAHPVVFAEIAEIDEPDAAAISLRATDIVSQHPEVVHSIVAAGLGISVEAAANMKFLAWLAVLQIVQLTQQHLAPERILAAAFEEMAALTLPGSATQ